ncbi:MAG: hypothetical protein ABI894_05430 [Ilumatobacteraceae bacterium]
MRTRSMLVAGVFSLSVIAAACGGSSTGSTTTVPATAAPPQTVPGGVVNPNGPEVVEPGDIPDDQVFVTFPSADGKYSVDVPEGWARMEHNGGVTFTDKYNSVTIESKPAASAATIDSVKTDGLVDVSSDATFTLTDVTPVTRKSGDGILATYEIGSAPNAVTGKQALLAVERYVFFRNGTQVTLTLSGAKGADNVDPWKIVSDSLAWI